MRVPQQGGELHIRVVINTTPIEYDYSAKGFRILGYKWDSSVAYDDDRSIDYWKAQLAFRGYTTRGSKLEVLKARLEAANTNAMDPQVRVAKHRMVKEWEKRNKWANRVIDRRLAMSDPSRFLEEIFYVEEGNDEGVPPLSWTAWNQGGDKDYMQQLDNCSIKQV